MSRVSIKTAAALAYIALHDLVKRAEAEKLDFDLEAAQLALEYADRFPELRNLAYPPLQAAAVVAKVIELRESPPVAPAIDHDQPARQAEYLAQEGA